MNKSELIDRINYLQDEQRKMFLQSIENNTLIDTDVIDMYRREMKICFDKLGEIQLKEFGKKSQNSLLTAHQQNIENK